MSQRARASVTMGPQAAPNPGAPRAPRVALVSKRSAWRLYVEERTDARLRELVEREDATVAPLKASHEAHVRTVREVKEALAAVDAELCAERLAGEPFESSGLDL